LSSLTSIPEGFNPTVGGSLDFANNQSKYIGANVPEMNYIEFQGGKYILIFKIGNRFKDNYKDLTIESKLTFEEAVKCYRVITGACQFGIKDFLQRKAINQKSFTISKIIELTNGEYGGSEFKTFFTK